LSGSFGHHNVIQVNSLTTYRGCSDNSVTSDVKVDCILIVSLLL